MASLTLPDSVMTDLQQIVSQSEEFKEVSDYVTYILQQVIEKKKKQLANNQGQTGYSEADEAKIRERLKNLGYLD